jgi:hypothetical protein
MQARTSSVSLTPVYSLAYGPCFFPNLARISEADEQAAIDLDQIHANRIACTDRRRQEGPARLPGRG